MRRSAVLPVVLVALGGCSALRPAVLRPALRRHASPVMQELGLATPEVAAKVEAHPITPLEECEVWDSSCPPVASTLELLEWDKLSAQVAGFAGTASAREMLRSTGLPLPQAREGSERLLAETREAWQIEQRLAKPLELRGFHDLTASVSLAQKGGVLDGEQLAKLASSLSTAATLSKQLRDVTAETEADQGAQPLCLLADLLNAVPLQAELRRELGSAIDEAGEVRDSASPTLGELRYVIRELATSTRRALGAILCGEQGLYGRPARPQRPIGRGWPWGLGQPEACSGAERGLRRASRAEA